MNGNYFFPSNEVTNKTNTQKRPDTNVIWEKIVTKTNYWIKTPREIMKI